MLLQVVLLIVFFLELHLDAEILLSLFGCYSWQDKSLLIIVSLRWLPIHIVVLCAVLFKIVVVVEVAHHSIPVG